MSADLSFLVLRHEASLKRARHSASRREVRRFLVLRHEASLKLQPDCAAPDLPMPFPRASARGLIEASSPATRRRSKRGFPRASARGLIEARTAGERSQFDDEVSSCFGTRPH